VGDLKRIFRLHKGRLRICWVGSSEERVIYILFISETLRKEGDASDPYKDLSRLIKAGTFNNLFTKIGMKFPPIILDSVN
jgi:hypothetical protein